MKKYRVKVVEVHHSHVEVDAKDEKDAVRRVEDGEGSEVDSEYGYTMESDLWEVQEIN